MLRPSYVKEVEVSSSLPFMKTLESLGYAYAR